MMWPFGSRTPKRQVKASQLDPVHLRADPIDPTLDNAAQELSSSIIEKALEAKRLSEEIVDMANALLREFEGKKDDGVPK